MPCMPSVRNSSPSWCRSYLRLPQRTCWRGGLRVQITLPALLPALLPPLRLVLVLWLFARGVMVLSTPLSGSWLNMAESIQRILGRRALDGQHPETTEQIIAWLEAAARRWNADPTPFVWGGKRAARRARARERRHALAGSGACSTRSLRWTRYGYARRK